MPATENSTIAELVAERDQLTATLHRVQDAYAQQTSRTSRLETLACQLIRLDNPDRLAERMVITLPDIIDWARKAYGEETDHDR